jgi:hypothetical protein
MAPAMRGDIAQVHHDGSMVSSLCTDGLHRRGLPSSSAATGHAVLESFTRSILSGSEAGETQWLPLAVAADSGLAPQTCAHTVADF